MHLIRKGKQSGMRIPQVAEDEVDDVLLAGSKK